MVVELEKLPECMRIWDIKEWLIDSSKMYPLRCVDYDYFCRCYYMLETLWLDDNFRRILSEIGIDRFERYNSYTWRLIHRQMINFAKKLCTGEEMVSNSNRALNVLTSSHVRRLAASVETAIRCNELKWRFAPPPPRRRF